MNKNSALRFHVTVFFAALAAGCSSADTDADLDADAASHRGGSRCTHDKDYWKTHNKYGEGELYRPWRTQAKAHQWFGWDEGSRALKSKTDEFECPSLGSYFDVLAAPHRGDLLLILAQKYIVAKLNLTSGASTGAAWDLVVEARDILADCRVDGSEREDARDLALDLHAYNEGEWGPGACPSP